MRVSLLVALLVLPLAGCEAPAGHPALKQAQFPPLLQAHEFASPGTVESGHQLSPDGRKLAWVGTSFARSALFVRDNESGEVRKYRARTAGFQWTPDGRRLLYASDKSGAENAHIYMLDTADLGAVVGE